MNQTCYCLQDRISFPATNGTDNTEMIIQALGRKTQHKQMAAAEQLFSEW